VSACFGIDISRDTIARLQPVPLGEEHNDKFYLDDKVHPMLAACVRLLGTVRPRRRSKRTCHIGCTCGWCMPYSLS